MAELTIQELEWRIKAAENKIDSIDDKIDKGFKDLKADIQALNFIRKDLYDSERKSLDDKMDSMKALVMWCLASIVGFAVTGVVAIALKVAG